MANYKKWYDGHSLDVLLLLKIAMQCDAPFHKRNNGRQRPRAIDRRRRCHRALKESSLKIRDWTLFSFHESELERPLLFVFYFDYVTRSFLI